MLGLTEPGSVADHVAVGSGTSDSSRTTTRGRDAGARPGRFRCSSGGSPEAGHGEPTPSTGRDDHDTVGAPLAGGRRPRSCPSDVSLSQSQPLHVHSAGAGRCSGYPRVEATCAMAGTGRCLGDRAAGLRPHQEEPHTTTTTTGTSASGRSPARPAVDRARRGRRSAIRCARGPGTTVRRGER